MRGFFSRKIEFHRSYARPLRATARLDSGHHSDAALIETLQSTTRDLDIVNDHLCAIIADSAMTNPSVSLNFFFNLNMGKYVSSLILRGNNYIFVENTLSFEKKNFERIGITLLFENIKIYLCHNNNLKLRRFRYKNFRLKSIIYNPMWEKLYSHKIISPYTNSKFRPLRHE